MSTVVKGRMLLFVPTYNEADNVCRLCCEIEELGLDADILFIDDNSPDGTGQILDDLAARAPRLRCVHRPAKLGIGSAHLQAIRWAYSQGYDVLLTMDADFTHTPAVIPEFIKQSPGFDVVVGSRFLLKESLPQWNLLRKTLTYGGHIATWFLLGMRLDATGAFRLYRLDRINAKCFDLVQSGGYAFFFESLYILWFNGVPVKEVPVVLPARTQGHSKMTIRDAVRSFRTLLSLCGRRYLGGASLRAPVASTDEITTTRA